MRTHFILAILATSAVFVGAAQRQPSEAQLQQMLRRFPGADLNKDGKLTLGEFREFRRKTRPGGATAAPRPANAPTATPGNVPLAGAVEIQITSDNPVPVNPRVYGNSANLKIFGYKGDPVHTPEKIAAIAELKLKIFQYGGGPGSWYHHPKGMGGLNIRPEEAAKSRHAGDPTHYTTVFASGPDFFEQYIQFVKACEGEAMFVANILHGTVAELEEYLSRLKDAGIPIACVILGQEMHLGHARSLGLEGYIERIKPYIAMLQAKYPHVPIVAHSTPVGRRVERAPASFHEWNRQLAKLPGISGFSQYGWPEFGTEVRRLRGAAAQTPDERWRQYDEFTRTFPDRQLPVYQRDWGADKKMYMTQWGTHLDRGTPLQGLHIANFYFFMAEYNAAHDDYFAMATLAQSLVEEMSKEESRRTGVIYKDKIALLTPYLYTKPFRHLFSGDKKLLAASVKAAENGAKGETVKALAAAGPDGRKYLYMLNSGPPVPLGKVAVDGNPLPADLRVQVESAFGNPTAARVGSAPVKTFTGEKQLRDLMLEPWSLTVMTIPTPGRKVSTRAKADPNPALAPIEKAAHPPADFDMAAYLDQLSANGKERGYKEVVYKQTPQGELRMYFAMPADWSPNDKRPALIFFFGGGWTSGKVLAFDKEAEYFAKCGIVVGLADYRVRKRHGVALDKCAEDARSAVRWVRANCRNLGVDPKRVIAGGGSAGGHIAACTAIPEAPNSDTDDLRVSCMPNGLLLFYPVVNLLEGRWKNAKQNLSRFGIGEDLANKLSPLLHVTKAWPPTVFFTGTADIGIPNAVLFHNKAKGAGATVELYVAEGRGHGVRKVVNIGLKDFISYAADFFMRAGLMDKGPLPEMPPGDYRKYNGEPVDRTKIFIKGAPAK